MTEKNFQVLVKKIIDRLRYLAFGNEVSFFSKFLRTFYFSRNPAEFVFKLCYKEDVSFVFQIVFSVGELTLKISKCQIGINFHRKTKCQFALSSSIYELQNS